VRATLCVEVDKPEQRLAAARWFESWREELTYVSRNHGCGCCVDLFDVEGSEAAIGSLPPVVGCQSDWSRGKGEPGQGGPLQNPYRAALRLKAKDRSDAQGRKPKQRR
jgi:hypothetical protein